MTTQAISQEQGGNSAAIGWAETGLIPDFLIRAGIRRLLKERLGEIEARDCEAAARHMNDFVQHMNVSRVALVPELANEQHYEVPAEFFGLVLGGHRKYSGCFWDETTKTLDDAELKALEITCERAGMIDGLDVLDLGCGWGSLWLYIA